MTRSVRSFVEFSRATVRLGRTLEIVTLTGIAAKKMKFVHKHERTRNFHGLTFPPEVTDIVFSNSWERTEGFIN